MIAAVHALVGAAVGRLAGGRGKAFAAGVSTHLLGDLLPHKDFAPRVEAPLLLGTLGFLAWRWGVLSPEFIGACGGAGPDVENGAQVLGLLPPEKMVFPTHRGTHGPVVASAAPQLLLAGACLAYLLWTDKGRTGG